MSILLKSHQAPRVQQSMTPLTNRFTTDEKKPSKNRQRVSSVVTLGFVQEGQFVCVDRCIGEYTMDDQIMLARFWSRSEKWSQQNDKNKL